jgi:hypothetical protein
MLQMDRYLLDNVDNIHRVTKSPLIIWKGPLEEYQQVCQCLYQHWLRFSGNKPQDPFETEHPFVWNMHPDENLCLNREYLTLDPVEWGREKEASNG